MLMFMYYCPRPYLCHHFPEHLKCSEDLTCHPCHILQVRPAEQVHAAQAVRLAVRKPAVLRCELERVRDDHHPGAGVSDRVRERAEGTERQLEAGFDQHQQQ